MIEVLVRVKSRCRRRKRTVMEMLFAEIELDLAQSIKRRQIVGRRKGVASEKRGITLEKKKQGE